MDVQSSGMLIVTVFVAVVALIFWVRSQAAGSRVRQEQTERMRDDLDRARDDVARTEERSTQLQQFNSALKEELQNHRRELQIARENLATANARLAGEEEKLKLLQQAKDELSDRFKTLAQEIFHQQTTNFTSQNKINLQEMLDPLKERLKDFQSKVEKIHHDDTVQQTVLKAELEQLKVLNQQMTQEAHGLAVALKGQTKKQGNWGELALGNLLDSSGLREGEDYHRERSFSNDEGRLQRPDVVVKLPQGKCLIIDAKVSLNAYVRYVNADDEEQRNRALQEHVQAVATHIRTLAERNYHHLADLNTPEMVFMFMPIESAFIAAVQHDPDLFQHAIEQHRVLVATPTTLLTSLRIVSQLWRFEARKALATELAESAAKVHKKLGNFLDSMAVVGEQLGKAQESYDRAMGQLSSGKGNLIMLAKDFERLGVAVQKALPEKLVEQAALEIDTHWPAELPQERKT